MGSDTDYETEMQQPPHVETIEGGYFTIHDLPGKVKAHPVLEWECQCGAEMATQGTQPTTCDDCGKVWRIEYP